jgi:membrane associated rhomboid family serine protease
VLQLLNGVAALGAETAQGGVAFFAHIGGFVFGLGVGVVARLFGVRARWRGQSAGSMG